MKNGFLQANSGQDRHRCVHPLLLDFQETDERSSTHRSLQKNLIIITHIFEFKSD